MIDFGATRAISSRHRAHDAGVGLDQVVPAHPRLPGDPGGHHEQLGARRLVVPVGADDPGVEALDGPGLPLIECLALRDALDDVDHHDGARELLFGQPLRRGRADVACPDDRHFLEHQDRSRACGLGEPPQSGECSRSGIRRPTPTGSARPSCRSPSYSTTLTALARLRLRTSPGIGMRKQRSGCFSRMRGGIPSVSLPKTSTRPGRNGAAR